MRVVDPVAIRAWLGRSKSGDASQALWFAYMQ
jgi:hypothetical protein